MWMIAMVHLSPCRTSLGRPASRRCFCDRRAADPFSMAIDQHYMSLSSRDVFALLVARDDLLQTDRSPTVRAGPCL